MPEVSNIEEGSKTAESSEKRKSVSDQKKNEPSEFRAKIIPYNTCGDSNAPVLAFSGDNINIIFNISKESFRKLAVAVIDHLGDGPEFKPSEKSAGDNQCSRHKEKKSEMSLKSSLNDVLRDLDADNTNDIINAYEEDSNEYPSSEDKDDANQADPKSRKDSSPLKEAKSSTHCNGAKFSDESLSNDSVNIELNQSTTTVVSFEESSNGIQTFPDSSSKTLLKSVPDKVDEKRNQQSNQTGVSGYKVDNIEHDAASDQQNHSATANEDELEMNLSAHSIDISYEDCPELKNSWPEIEPFKETEEIPLKELKSMLLNGVLTKYLKLEISNEFIVLKVTGGSDVLVDAVKYKETMNDLSLKSEKDHEDSNKSNLLEKRTESFSRKICAKSKLLTTVGNLHEISMSETKASELHENMSDKQNKDEHSYLSELVTEKKMDSVPASPVLEDDRSLEPQMSLNIQSKEPNTNSTTLNEISSNLSTKDAKNLKSLDLEIKNLISANPSSNPRDDISVDETFEQNSDMNFENEKFQKIISLKIEKKLEEIDINVRGSSPTERLKYTLDDCLKNSFNETETQVAEKCITDTSEKLLNESNAKVCSSESSNECDNSQSQEKYFKEVDTSDKYAAEAISKSCNSNEVTEPAHKLKSESVDNISPNTEIELLNVSKWTSTSSENESIDDSPDNDESGNVNKDRSAVSKSIASDQNESCLIPVEETKVDLNVSENEVLNVSGQSKIYKHDDSDSHENHEKISCVLKEETGSTNENEISEIDANDLNCASENRSGVQNEQSNEAEESDCERKSVIKDTKLETSERSFENSVEKLQQTTSTDNINADEDVPDENLERATEEMNKRDEKSREKDENCRSFGKTSEVVESFSAEQSPENKCAQDAVESESSDVEDVKNEEMDGSSEEFVTDASVEVVLNEASDPESLNDTSLISSEKTFTEQNSECIDESTSDAADYEEKLPERSFASNLDSFMDTTIEACSESMSEGGDLESDDKSIASESDDSKDSEKQAAARKGLKKSKYKADEVDCAPTRTRRKAVIGLSKDVIPENTEVKNGNISKNHGSILNVPSKYSGRISPIGRSLRSKSLDPTPQQSKAIDKKHSIVESEEVNRRARAKTPDIISKKDIKTTVRSSPRKLTRSSAAAEPSSASKVQSAKTSVADAVPKSRANLDASTSKRNKRSSKD